MNKDDKGCNPEQDSGKSNLDKSNPGKSNPGKSKKNYYKQHQDLIKNFKLQAGKSIPEMRVFDRHVGMFYTKNGIPIKINSKGMADCYGIINIKNILIHIEIEAKTGNARMSVEQLAWKKFITSMGGKHFLLQHVDKTIKEIQDYISEIQKKIK